MAPRRRSVVHESEFIDDLSRLISDDEKALEYISAAEDLLSREPESGACLDEDGCIWFLDLPPIREIQIGLYYTLTEETVIFLNVLKL